MTEDFLTLYVDPGEDTGWALGCGTKLVSAGTGKMWPFADEVWKALTTRDSQLFNPDYARNLKAAELLHLTIGRVVCEDFRLYPWKAKDLSWDSMRTPRLIGALKMMCRIKEIPMILQPASIKKTAVAGGAEEYFYRPLHENRHQNDAVMHFAWYNLEHGEGLPKLPSTVSPKAEG